MKKRYFFLTTFIIYISLLSELSVLGYEFFRIEELLLYESSLKSDMVSEHYLESKIAFQFGNKLCISIISIVFVNNVYNLWKFTNFNGFSFSFLVFFIFELLCCVPFHFWDTFIIEKRFKFNRMSPNLFYRDQIIQISFHSIILLVFIIPLILFVSSKTNDEMIRKLEDVSSNSSENDNTETEISDIDDDKDRNNEESLKNNTNQNTEENKQENNHFPKNSIKSHNFHIKNKVLHSKSYNDLYEPDNLSILELGDALQIQNNKKEMNNISFDPSYCQRKNEMDIKEVEYEKYDEFIETKEKDKETYQTQNENQSILNDFSLDKSVHLLCLILLILFLIAGTFSLFLEKINSDLIDASILDGGIHFYGIVNNFELTTMKNNQTEESQLLVEMDLRNSHFKYKTVGLFDIKPIVSENLFFLLPYEDLAPLGVLISSEIKNQNSRKIYLFKSIYVLLFIVIFSIYSNSNVAKDFNLYTRSDIIPIFFLSLIITYSLSFFIKPLENSYRRILMRQSDILAGKTDVLCINFLILLYKKDLRLVDASPLYRLFYSSESKLEERLESLTFGGLKYHQQRILRPLINISVFQIS